MESRPNPASRLGPRCKDAARPPYDLATLTAVVANQAPSILFAGGGSGGHISPGLAIDERVRELNPEARTIFLCSNRAIDAAMLGEAGVRFIALPAAPPPSPIRYPLRFAKFVRAFSQSKRLAMKVMRDEAVTHVVALGGFAAAPVVKAAKALGVPTLLVNLDAPPGRANRWMAKDCTKVVSAIEVPMLPDFASEVVGLPIRTRAIAPAGADARECRSRLELDPNLPVLLITGASQGATSVNELMIELARSRSPMFEGWQILHLAGGGGGPAADQPLREAYANAGIRATVLPFVHEMGLAWGAAELAISRAGANSVAEVWRNAVPTLFLPYPYHADMHQQHNARPLVDWGGAAMATDHIDAGINAAKIGPVIESLMRDAAKRHAMRDALRARPMPDAAMTIAKSVL